MKTAADLLKSKAHQSVHTITSAASVFDAVKLMADKNIGALLVMEGEEVAGIITERDYARKIVLMSRSSRQTTVMDGNKLLGLISIGDLVKSIITEQKFTIEQLEHYISGERG